MSLGPYLGDLPGRCQPAGPHLKRVAPSRAEVTRNPARYRPTGRGLILLRKTGDTRSARTTVFLTISAGDVQEYAETDKPNAGDFQTRTSQVCPFVVPIRQSPTGGRIRISHESWMDRPGVKSREGSSFRIRSRMTRPARGAPGTCLDRSFGGKAAAIESRESAGREVGWFLPKVPLFSSKEIRDGPPPLCSRARRP